MNPSDETITPKGRGRGPWKQGLDHKELRRPRNEENIGCATNSNSLNNVEDPGAGGDVQKTGSTLSATAKEFYPKGYQPPEGRSYNSQFAEAVPEGGDQPSTAVQIARNHILEMMQHLTLNPGRFDALIAPLVDTFRVWMQQEDTDAAVVDVIVDQSITEPNLRYNGARLCSFLNNEFSAAFRSSLLRRCQQEYTQMRTNLYCAPARLRGYSMFMAELFMQLEVVQGHGDRIAVLGTGIMESLDLLLTNPAIDNIKCVCNVLKLTGYALDTQDPFFMNKIIYRLSSLCELPSLDENTRHLISGVVQLKQLNWGEASSLAPKNSTTPQYNTSLNEPVFYGPDGQIMTPEESQFLQESAGRIPDSEDYDEYGEDGEAWIPDDEMDEEIQAAFEQFLKMGKNSKSSDNKCCD